MRTDCRARTDVPKRSASLASAAATAGALLLLLTSLSGCPGTLDDRQRFLVDASVPDGPDAGGAAASQAGTGGGPSGGGAGASGAGGGNAGAAGEPEEGGVVPCGESDLITRILQPGCGGVGCHGASAPQQELDLVTPGLALRVVGVTGKECAVKLADPNAPKSSLLYEKLSTSPPCGAQMPLARPPLSSADTQCLLKWIGAQ